MLLWFLSFLLPHQFWRLAFSGELNIRLKKYWLWNRFWTEFTSGTCWDFSVVWAHYFKNYTDCTEKRWMGSNFQKNSVANLCKLLRSNVLKICKKWAYLSDFKNNFSVIQCISAMIPEIQAFNLIFRWK